MRKRKTLLLLLLQDPGTNIMYSSGARFIKKRGGCVFRGLLYSYCCPLCERGSMVGSFGIRLPFLLSVHRRAREPAERRGSSRFQQPDRMLSLLFCWGACATHYVFRCRPLATNRAKGRNNNNHQKKRGENEKKKKKTGNIGRYKAPSIDKSNRYGRRRRRNLSKCNCI